MCKEFNHVFECSRIKNDSAPGDEAINIHTPNDIAFISRADAIAIALFYELIEEDDAW